MEKKDSSNSISFKNLEDRFQLWSSFIDQRSLKSILEIGVYKGEFAKHILKNCHSIKDYYMIDPWRNIPEWNKPANTDDHTFEKFYEETINNTKFAEEKIKILRGKTTEVIDSVENDSLDFVYIDGDHTLKGISIDLISVWSKVRWNGFIAGDDFCPSIWQHDEKFEPTLVFPFAVYFAEAMNVKIYGLANNQFLISKSEKGFKFIDKTEGKYNNISLMDQLSKYQNSLPKKRKSLRDRFK